MGQYTRKPDTTPGLLVAVTMLSVLLTVPIAAHAEDYVSFNGKFRITLPEGWNRADYRTVDYWLQQAGSGREALNYEVVYSPNEGGLFAQDEYLILTLDLIGEQTETQIDSILKDMGGVFGEGLKYMPVQDFMTNMESDAPVYDSSNKTVSVVTDLSRPGEEFKKNWLVMKFYEQGIANFYFYSPDSVFEATKPVFAGIVSSFSTDNLETSGSAEDVRVADLEERQSDRGLISEIMLGLGVLILIAVLVIRIRRSRKNA
ncbi:MAG: hypothetical protein JSU65_10020 [Candidatus Zixiibacteriota bacterium]|nr:MAG: hypothetical protein JSU65_10020 [candidate division Zixibacteria bacterium]